MESSCNVSVKPKRFIEEKARRLKTCRFIDVTWCLMKKNLVHY